MCYLHDIFVACVSLLYVPNGHSIHTESDVYVPAGHGGQSILPGVKLLEHEIHDNDDGDPEEDLLVPKKDVAILKET